MRKVLLGLLFLFVGTFVVSVPIGVLGSSNLVWGEDNQYGSVPVPGTKVLHLPAREIDVSYAVDIVGRGNETPDVPLPKLSLSVVRVGGPDDVRFTESIGDSSNANADGANTQRRVWKIDVPTAGVVWLLLGRRRTA